MSGQVALVTGASSGIGRATALELKRLGFVVYGAARRVEKMADLRKAGVLIHPLDITDDLSRRACVSDILAAQGRIDVLINNAGYGACGALEDVPPEEARRQMEVNLIGLMAMTQLALPGMRAQKSGRIINIASAGGRIWMPYCGWYHAAKFALEGLSHCLRMEVKPFGIRVILMEPGAIATSWGQIAAENLLKASGEGPYAQGAAHFSKGLAWNYARARLLTSPDRVARRIGKAATKRRTRTRYLLGLGARPAVALHALLGDRGYDRCVSFFIRKIL